LTTLDQFLIRYRRPTTWWLAGGAFVALNVVMRFSVDQPPVWDGAMSVYPAAIELASTNFDFSRLFSLPTYAEGGPNTHATSPWTIMVGGLISLTGSLARALPILHVVSFGLAALTFAATYRLIAHAAPGLVAVVGALAALIFPPMIVQSAEIYLDLPLACLGTWSLVMLLERRLGAASVLTTVAVWVKPLAVIFVSVGVLFVLMHDERRGRAFRAARLFAPALMVAAAVSFLQASASVAPPLMDRYVIAVGGSAQLLQAMPDLVAIILAAVLILPLLIKGSAKQETFTLMTLLLISVVAFVLLNPLVSHGIPILPRYYIAILPAVIAAVLTVLRFKSRQMALAAGTMLVLVFAVNVNGVLYPFGDHATHALAERSLAYRDLLALQLEDVRLLAELGSSMPVYYDYFGYYRYEYPELGYSDGPVPSGVSVYHHPELGQASLDDFPTNFAFAYEYPVLGGEVLLRIWEEAIAAGVHVTETALTRGSYTVYVVQIDQARSASS
jgi:hypothetical protein